MKAIVIATLVLVQSIIVLVCCYLDLVVWGAPTIVVQLLFVLWFNAYGIPMLFKSDNKRGG